VWISQKSRRLSNLGMRKRYVDTLSIGASSAFCRREGSSAHTSRSRGCGWDWNSPDQRKPTRMWCGSRNVNVGLMPNSGVDRGFFLSRER
jgi:hypothetical protein